MVFEVTHIYLRAKREKKRLPKLRKSGQSFRSFSGVFSSTIDCYLVHLVCMNPLCPSDCNLSR